MIGILPKSLELGGVLYPIETDYRNVLVFLSACADPELSDEDKLLILMKRLYRDGFSRIPRDSIREAALKAKWFIDCGQEEEGRRPEKKMMDWEQDEAVLFPAINKVAGMEVRAAGYIHWWTFAGYFMEIEDGTFSTVLSIRQKKAGGKPLEKWERDFYMRNKSLCDIKARYTREEQEERDRLNKLLG